MSIPFFKIRIFSLFITLVALLGGFVACSSSTPQPSTPQAFYDNGPSPFAHHFNATNANACEAARRALLNQGYVTTLTRVDTINATKDFQPTGDTHLAIEFHIVCVPGDESSDTSIVFANAVQSGYALKKNDTSASVGLSVLGSVSLPIRSSSDAMVKVSSETIQSAHFYDQFFDFVGRYLHAIVKTTSEPPATPPITKAPLPAETQAEANKTKTAHAASASIGASIPASAPTSASTAAAAASESQPAANQH